MTLGVIFGETGYRYWDDQLFLHRQKPKRLGRSRNPEIIG